MNVHTSNAGNRLNSKGSKLIHYLHIQTYIFIYRHILTYTETEKNISVHYNISIQSLKKKENSASC